uniref:SH3 domain containing GRB2 like 2a, endophilin A1 n=1 Tax=Takifugu rubripes TaxID=31033 RepID=A0A674NRN3_TAKRU
MSVAGLKKQFHKATQKVSEKVGGAEGTKLDDDFTEMEKRVDTTSRAVLDIMTKTTEYLQPNPATRAKMSMMNSMSRMRGQEKGPGYTQTEAILGECDPDPATPVSQTCTQTGSGADCPQWRAGQPLFKQ